MTVLHVELNVGQNLVFGDEHSFSYGSCSGNNQLSTHIVIMAGIEYLKKRNLEN